MLQILRHTNDESCKTGVFDAFRCTKMEDENDYSYVIQSGVYFITVQNSTFEGNGALVHYVDD